MGRRCKSCAHPKRREIEIALLSDNVNYREIGKEYGLSNMSLARHLKGGHIAENLVRSEELKKIAFSEDLLEKLKQLQNEAMKILGKAENPEDGNPSLSIALAAIRGAHSMLETQAKLAGQLKEQEINILINPTWISLKETIFLALKPFPEAQAAVFAAVAGGDLTDTQKKMIEGEKQWKPVTPGVMEIINKEFLQGDHSTHNKLLPSEIHDKKAKKQKGWKQKPATPASVTRVRLLCVKEHSYRGKLWSPGQIWDSEKPDGPEPGGGNWTIFNPAIHSGLEPTARR